MRPSHHSFLNIGQIKKTFFVKNIIFFMGNNNLTRNQKSDPKKFSCLCTFKKLIVNLYTWADNADYSAWVTILETDFVTHVD